MGCGVQKMPVLGVRSLDIKHSLNMKKT